MRALCLAMAVCMPSLSSFVDTATAQMITEEIDVRVVNVDVVVTDRGGKRVAGLTRDQFRLFEDGRPVEIAYFSPYADGQMQRDEPPAGTAVASTNETDQSRAPVTWAVFIDQTSMRPAMRNHALRQLRVFLDGAIKDGDRAMLTVVDGQAFRVSQNITTERPLLMSALAATEREAVHFGPGVTDAAAIKREINWVEPTDPEIRYMARSIAQRISSVIVQETRRTRNAIAAMRALLTVLTRIDGRVALLYVGAGFNTLPGSDLAQSWRQAFAHVSGIGFQDLPHPEEHQLVLDQEIEQLYGQLHASRVTIYSIHPGDAVIMGADDAGIVITQQTVEGFRATDGEILGDRGEIRQASLAREIAAYTGGESFRVNPGLAKQLDAVRADFNDYYSLGYIPRGEPTKVRKIKVEVALPGARIRHRDSVRERSRWEEAGYDLIASRAQPPRNIIGTPLRLNARVASSASPEETNPFGVSVSAAQVKRAGRREHVLGFRFTTRLDTLSFAKGDAGLRADLVFHFALVGRDGTLWPIESREQALEIPASEVPSTSDVMNFSWGLDLAPLKIPSIVPVRDAVQLKVLVVDRTSQLRSVVTVPVPRG